MSEPISVHASVHANGRGVKFELREIHSYGQHYYYLQLAANLDVFLDRSQLEQLVSEIATKLDAEDTERLVAEQAEAA